MSNMPPISIGVAVLIAGLLVLTRREFKRHGRQFASWGIGVAIGVLLCTQILWAIKAAPADSWFAEAWDLLDQQVPDQAPRQVGQR